MLFVGHYQFLYVILCWLKKRKLKGFFDASGCPFSNHFLLQWLYLNNRETNIRRSFCDRKKCNIQYVTSYHILLKTIELLWGIYKPVTNNLKAELKMKIFLWLFFFLNYGALFFCGFYWTDNILDVRQFLNQTDWNLLNQSK